MYVKLLERASVDRSTWGNVTLIEAVREVDVATARFRPGPGRPSIWEIVRHVTHWQQAVTTAWDHGQVDARAWNMDDWSPLPSDDAAWSDDREALATASRRLMQRLTAGDEGFLDHVVHGLRGSVADTIVEVLRHDAYHAGQVRLILALHDAWS